MALDRGGLRLVGRIEATWAMETGVLWVCDGQCG